MLDIDFTLLSKTTYERISAVKIQKQLHLKWKKKYGNSMKQHD